ncbi:MAG: hypothetical protein A2086_08665 [Spirochaetes bacterium GWD1_27_9]|nr:MAG: hypothetical protein A2Z98_10215 [Spirochaetes bacterium GWB1_27_13]OHD26564.1 MAG: hypothetical protein A2Y34_07990 [Spirochaetes bacterium GWC1_27_15]OHD39970.1 MAG: hypothetical protein A2086_08665 [Spirochaetes bacterium GWD1_27_9]
MRNFFIFIFLCVFVIVNAQDNTTDTTPVKKTMNGWDFFSAGRYQDSLKVLDDEKKNFPDRINIYVIMAWDYRELKNFTAMESVSLEGLKIQPTDARILKNLAEAYHFQKKYSDAVVAFEKYIKYKFSWNDPYLPFAYYYIGVCYYYLRNYRKADIALATSNHYSPKNYNTIILFAEVKEILGEFKAAFNLFTQANQIQPNTQRALDGIGRTKDK